MYKKIISKHFWETEKKRKWLVLLTVIPTILKEINKNYITCTIYQSLVECSLLLKLNITDYLIGDIIIIIIRVLLCEGPNIAIIIIIMKRLYESSHDSVVLLMYSMHTISHAAGHTTIQV